MASELISKLLNSLIEGRLSNLEHRNKNEIEELEHLGKESEKINKLMIEVDEKMCLIIEGNKLPDLDLAKTDRKSRNVDPTATMFEPSPNLGIKTLKTNKTVANLNIGKSIDKKEKSLTRGKSSTSRALLTTRDGADTEGGNKVLSKTPKKQESTGRKKTISSTTATSANSIPPNTSRPSTSKPKSGKTPLKKKDTLTTKNNDENIKEPSMKKNLTVKNLNKKETPKTKEKDTPRNREPPNTSRNGTSNPKLTKSKTKTDVSSKVKSSKRKISAAISEGGGETEKSVRISNLELKENLNDGSITMSNTLSQKNKINIFTLNESPILNNPTLTPLSINTLQDTINPFELSKTLKTEQINECEIKISEENSSKIIFQTHMPVSESLLKLHENQKVEQIIKYLDKKDKILSFPVNKLIGQYSIENLLEEAKRNLEESENKLSAFQLKNGDTLNVNSETDTHFVMTRGANRAVDLLNEAMYNKIFSQGSNPNDDVKLIYRVFFHLINLRHIAEIPNGNEFWKECSKYIINEGNGKTGVLINEAVLKFDFSPGNIYRINKIVEKHISKIAPAYFSKICGTTGLFIFLIKDALEYAGIIYQDKKTPLGRILQNLISFIEIEKEKVKRLESLLHGIYKR